MIVPEGPWDKEFQQTPLRPVDLDDGSRLWRGSALSEAGLGAGAVADDPAALLRRDAAECALRRLTTSVNELKGKKQNVN